ncbi:MAG: PKD domain-containing protein, partial [Bacteroidales bacterium]|nr:PKD domain-containing protein [Bacteroidales bacterium]
MRKFLLINGLILIIGYVIAQTPKVTGDFAQGLRCVSASQSAMFNFINSSGNQGGITHVKWEIKDNATGNVINTNSDATNNLSYLYLFSQAGTYRCVMTVTWGSTVRMDSMTVKVHTMPKFSYTKSTDSICPGEGITFNYTMISPFTKGMVKSVAWDFGDGGRSTLETPTYNYQNGRNVESSYTVSLTVKDTNQCEATVDSVRYIFVRTKPVVRFAADNTYFCFSNTTNPQGNPIFTNYTDTGKTGINNTYQWNFGDGATSTSEHPSHAYGPGDYVVTLIATSQYGCVDSLRRNNYITVKHLVPNFIISDTILCSLPATISAEGKDGSVYYDWLIDNMTGGGQTGRTPEFEIREVDEGIHTLKLTIEDRRSTGEKCVVDTTITLHFYNKITSQITATDTNECDPDHVISFTNTTQYKPWAEDFGMAKTYWNFGDATNGTGPTTTHVYGTSAVPDGESPDGGYGDYRVMMSGTTPYGCPLDTVYQNIHIFRMHAVAEMTNPAPPNPPHGCAPHTVELENVKDKLVTSSDIVSFIWKWNFTGDNAKPNDTTVGDISGAVQHTYTDTGQYYVYLTLTNEQGCVHDIFVKYIMVGYPPVTDFTFVQDTNCKSELKIEVQAYDSLDANGNLVSGKETGNGSRANAWEWLDDEDNPIGGPTETSTISPNEVGEAVVKLVSSHNGCKTEFPVKKEALGYVCPPIATIKEPKDDDSGNPPLYCEFKEIPFKNDSKGALYLKWYAGDYFPNNDTAEHSKSPLMVYDTTLKDYIRYDENGDSVGTGANWAFTYSDTSASNYLMRGNGLVTLWLWAMNNDTTIMDTTNEFFNMCRKKCEHVATQDLIISILKMNFTVSQDGICQGDSVRFYDSTQASTGIFGWGFKFDSAWNSDPNYLDMTLGKFVEIKNYTPDPKYGDGHWYPFTKPNKYRVVLQDTCVHGCIENDTLVIDVLPRSVPRITTSVDGITYNYGKADTLCINSGGQYYLRDSSWSPHPYENTQIIGWEWLLGTKKDSVQHPVIVQTSAGHHHLNLTVKNEYGCDSTGKFEYQLLANSIIPRFTTPKKDVCNKIEISFTDETTVLPIPNNKNTLLELVYDWGDGDTSVVRSKSGERLTTGHSYDLPNLKNTVYIKLTATIIDPVTYLPTGCKEEY